MLRFSCLFKVLKQNLITCRQSYMAFFFSPRCKTTLNLLCRSADTEEIKCYFAGLLKPLIDFFLGSHRVHK